MTDFLYENSTTLDIVLSFLAMNYQPGAHTEGVLTDLILLGLIR